MSLMVFKGRLPIKQISLVKNGYKEIKSLNCGIEMSRTYSGCLHNSVGISKNIKVVESLCKVLLEELSFVFL